MVWYGMVWYGMVWYGMVWYGMVWYGMVWYGMVWYGMVWYHTILMVIIMQEGGWGEAPTKEEAFWFYINNNTYERESLDGGKILCTQYGTIPKVPHAIALFFIIFIQQIFVPGLTQQRAERDAKLAHNCYRHKQTTQPCL
jgi:hypothetical protein